MDVGYSTYAFTILIVPYFFLGIGLPVALIILALHFQRLLLFKQPPREVIISVFLPLGPYGQGGEALLHLREVAYRLFPIISTQPGTGVPSLNLPVGQSIFSVSLVGALFFWAFGVWWLFLAVATLVREVRSGRISFNMGWWAAVFPMASLAICTARLADALDSLALRVVYTAFFFATLAMWFTITVPTAKGFVDGSLLSREAAPCITDLPLDPLKRDSEEEEQYDTCDEDHNHDRDDQPSQDGEQQRQQQPRSQNADEPEQTPRVGGLLTPVAHSRLSTRLSEEIKVCGFPKKLARGTLPCDRDPL